MRLGVIVGLKSEAKIAARLGAVAVAGARPELAAAGARRLVDDGATALLSFGLAGGLAPGLATGDLVIALSVLIGEARHPTDTALTNRFAEVLPDAHLGAIVGSDAPVADAAAKRTLHERTGAIAVDMESQALTGCGVPFAVLRAVVDPHDRSLPPAALVGVKPDGASDVAAVLASLLRQPWQLPRLLLLARDSNRAIRSLDRAVEKLM